MLSSGSCASEGARSVDLMGLPFELPETGGSIYYRDGNDIINPRWSVKNAGSRQLTNRVFGTASLQYDFSDNLNLLYRVGVDFYNERNTQFSNKDGVNFNQAIFGFYQTWDNNNRIWDHYLSLSGDYDLTDKFGLRVLRVVQKFGQGRFKGGPVSLTIRVFKPEIHYVGKRVVKIITHIVFDLYTTGGQYTYQKQGYDFCLHVYSSIDCFSLFDISKAE